MLVTIDKPGPLRGAQHRLIARPCVSGPINVRAVAVVSLRMGDCLSPDLVEFEIGAPKLNLFTGVHVHLRLRVAAVVLAPLGVEDWR